MVLRFDLVLLFSLSYVSETNRSTAEPRDVTHLMDQPEKVDRGSDGSSNAFAGSGYPLVDTTTGSW